MIILVCDHCGVDYSTCSCLAGVANILPAPLPPITSEDDDFLLTPNKADHTDTHPFCFGCSADLDEWEQACDQCMHQNY